MIKVVSVRYLGKEDVYNMEVEKTHNYITARGTILHNCVDALRYFAISRTIIAENEKTLFLEDEYEDNEEDYNTFMTGGKADNSYIL